MDASQFDVMILIATLNRWESLKATLESLQALSLPPNQRVFLRVVDNGSQDGSWEKLLDYSIQVGPIPIEAIRQPRPGKSAALNFGLRTLPRNFVAFTDDDVTVSPQWLCAYHDRLITQKLWSGASGPVHLKLEGKPPVPLITERLAVLLGATPRTRKEGELLSGLPGANMAVVTDAICRIGNFSEELGPARGIYRTAEDMEWSHRIIQHGLRLGFCEDASLEHIFPADRCTRRFLWSRQLEYVRREHLLKLCSGETPATPMAFFREVRQLLGSLVKRKNHFEGFDYALELASRVGRATAYLDYLNTRATGADSSGQ